MVLEVFPMSEVLLPFSCAVLCSIDIFGILEHISWHYFIFLATNSSSWLIWAFSIILDVLHLLVHDFSVGFVSKFSSYLEHIFFPLYILLYCPPMLVCLYFPIPSESLVPLCCSFGFLPIIWFLLQVGFFWTLLSLPLC